MSHVKPQFRIGRIGGRTFNCRGDEAAPEQLHGKEICWIRPVNQLAGMLGLPVGYP
jgi:hypothetical protein